MCESENEEECCGSGAEEIYADADYWPETLPIKIYIKLNIYAYVSIFISSEFYVPSI